ncbi:MAG: hypothetical protein IPL59_04950 [Candidatus Competibacteraceae bacterium]|nr:hypothetical protein [Candidatus Competibacteraceae bacterium]MBK8755087.1 hypothetical protein [Candidatus Competibacteraceae bacterium]
MNDLNPNPLDLSTAEKTPGVNAYELVTDLIAALQRLAINLQAQPRDIDPLLYDHLALSEYYLTEAATDSYRLH